jgi:hypothetical protein
MLRHFEVPTHQRQQDPRMLLRRALQSEDMLHVVPFNWQRQFLFSSVISTRQLIHVCANPIDKITIHQPKK